MIEYLYENIVEYPIDKQLQASFFFFLGFSLCSLKVNRSSDSNETKGINEVNNFIETTKLDDITPTE